MSPGSVKDAIEALYKPIESIVKTLAGPAAEEIGLGFRDSVQAWRFKRQVRLFKRVQELCAESGINPQAVKLSFLFDVVDKATLEENDDLQDLWANLLANAADPEYKSLISTAFPEILRQLSKDEAVFLEAFYEVGARANEKLTVQTERQPEVTENDAWSSPFFRRIPYLAYYRRIPYFVKLEDNFKHFQKRRQLESGSEKALELFVEKEKQNTQQPTISDIYGDNLKRLGLIEQMVEEKVPDYALTGDTISKRTQKETPRQWKQTALGRAFINACTSPKYRKGNL